VPQVSPVRGGDRADGRVRVITTCSHRKALPPGPRIRNVESASVEDRVKRWIKALERSHGRALAAEDMYQGGHWSIVRSLSVDTWVCSAGYGFIPRSAEIRSYGATFSAGHPDSVVDGAQSSESASSAAQTWWSKLAEWAGPGTGRPRSIRALAEAEPEAPMLIAVSVEYLQAIRRDVIMARDQLTDPDRLIIISAGAEEDSELSANLLPGDSRLQSWLGGPLGSLNAGLAKKILDSGWELSASGLRGRLADTLEGLEYPQRPQRTRCTDEEIRAFVRNEFDSGRRWSYTRLLRRLRDSGLACEQSRFRRLYRSVSDQQQLEL